MFWALLLSSPLIKLQRKNISIYENQYAVNEPLERYYPKFQLLLSKQETPLPYYVQAEFEAYLKCGRLEYGLYVCNAKAATMND